MICSVGQTRIAILRADSTHSCVLRSPISPVQFQRSLLPSPFSSSASSKFSGSSADACFNPALSLPSTLHSAHIPHLSFFPVSELNEIPISQVRRAKQVSTAPNLHTACSSHGCGAGQKGGAVTCVLPSRGQKSYSHRPRWGHDVFSPNRMIYKPHDIYLDQGAAIVTIATRMNRKDSFFHPWTGNRDPGRYPTEWRRWRQAPVPPAMNLHRRKRSVPRTMAALRGQSHRLTPRQPCQTRTGPPTRSGPPTRRKHENAPKPAASVSREVRTVEGSAWLIEYSMSQATDQMRRGATDM